MQDHFQTLGLESPASKEQIKKAYRLYATKYHPDKQQGDKFFEDKFKEIQEAYDYLMNKDSDPVYKESSYVPPDCSFGSYEPLLKKEPKEKDYSDEYYFSKGKKPPWYLRTFWEIGRDAFRSLKKIKIIRRKKGLVHK